MAKNFLCKIGLHSWTYKEAVYSNKVCEELAIPEVQGSRTCSHCGKTQYEDVHCLGLNPPEYVVTYR